MAVNKISKTSRDKIISKSVQPLPNNPGKAGMKADAVKKAMFAFVTDEKESVVEEINRVVEEINDSFDNVDNTNQEISKLIESINNNIKQINNEVSNKVEKEDGKGLSTNDFSTQEKNKLAGLNNYDDSEIKGEISGIKKVIQNQTTESNKLADKDFVNSSIETATATFKGTFENLDLLKATLADKNDYAFYDHISNSNRVFDRYKHNGTEWVYEYTLNNSSFTDAQWKAINSGATAELINQILTNADSINSILNTLETIDADLQETKTKTTNAINTAESAYTKANNAFNEASNATTIGLQAKTEAVTAQNLANNAQQTANEALEKAEQGVSGDFLPLDGGTLTGDLSVEGQIKFPNDVPTDNDSSWIYVCKNSSAKQGFGATSLSNLKSKFADTYLKLTGGALTGSLQVKKGTDWGQTQIYSAGNVYHAFEASDNLIRFDCRNFNGAGTDNRRILDLCCSRYKTNPVDGLAIWSAYTSLLKTGSIIKSGSKLNGTAYSTDTTLNADLNITASSTLKTGSVVKANSIVNGNKYTADTTTTADITLTNNTGTTNKIITDAGGTMKGALNMSKNDITNAGRIYNYGNLATAGRDSGDTGTYFFEVARCTVTEGYRGVYALINVHDCDSMDSCLLELNTYRSTASNKPVVCIGVKSTVDDGVSSYWLDKFYCVANYNSNSTTTVYQLFLKTTATYQGCRFVFLDETANFRNRTTHSFWTKYNNTSTASGYVDAIPKLSGYDLQVTAVDNSFGQVRANTIITNGNKTVTIPNENGTMASRGWVNTVNAMQTNMSAKATDQHDTVKEFWMNSDGTEWHRIWRSGFKEWGMLKSNSSNTDAVSITFTNFSFSSTNYIIQANMRGSKTSGGTADTTLVVRGCGLVHTQTTTGFQFQALARNYMLYACGI